MQSFIFSGKRTISATKSHFPTFQRKKSLILRFPEKYKKAEAPFALPKSKVLLVTLRGQAASARQLLTFKNLTNFK